MNSLFENNLKAYALRYPDPAKFIGSLDSTSYEIRQSVTGRPVLYVTTASGRDLSLDHPEDPEAEAKACLSAEPGQTYFVVMGMGLGYLLFEALARYPEGRFLVIEQDPKIFKKALEAFDFTEILKNPAVEFVVGIKPEHLQHCFHGCFARHNNDEFLASVKALQNPRIVGYARDYYVKASHIFSQSVNNFFDLYVGNSVRDSLIGMNYALKNAKYLNRMFLAESLNSCFKGLPGIVVASGPSLNNKLDWLREVNDRAVIICADSALRKLVENGITPFGVACLERDDENAEYFLGFDIPQSIVLFAPLLIKPSTFASYPGPIGLVYRNTYPYSWLPQLMTPNFTGMSCAHLCYNLLLELGCEPIGLVGQDLAYDRETGSSHFSGVLDFAEKQYAAQTRIMVPDHNGGQIATSYDWRLFREIYEEMIQLQHAEHKTFNVIESQRGAAITGAKRIEPEHFFEQIRLREERLPVADLAAAQLEMGRQVLLFMRELETKKHAAVMELSKFKNGLNNLASVATHAEFCLERDSLYASLSPDNRYLVDQLFRPDMKRFDSCAKSLWKNGEFLEVLPPLLERCEENLDELLMTLGAA